MSYTNTPSTNLAVIKFENQSSKPSCKIYTRTSSYTLHIWPLTRDYSKKTFVLPTTNELGRHVLHLSPPTMGHNTLCCITNNVFIIRLKGSHSCQCLATDDTFFLLFFLLLGQVFWKIPLERMVVHKGFVLHVPQSGIFPLEVHMKNGGT